jgi:large subunit ribosomal protein L25
LELIELKANVRTKGGNGPAKRLRLEGQMPAVLYGPGNEPAKISVETHALEVLLKKHKVGQVVFNLSVDGTAGSKTAMIKELQQDCLTGRFLHADFYEVAMNRKVRVKVPVHTTGLSIGVEKGGVLQLIHRELEVLCFPNQIPQSIELDVTPLEIGDGIHVKEISLGQDIDIHAKVNFTVASVVGRKIERGEGANAEGEAEGAG